MKKMFSKSIVFILVISHSFAQFAYGAGNQRTAPKQPGTKINDQTTQSGAKKADPELTNKISATFQDRICLFKNKINIFNMFQN